MKRPFLLACLIVVLGAAPIHAAKYAWLKQGTYDPAIPAPESILGYEIGSYLTDHGQMLEYMRKLDESTDRVRMFEYGASYEGRKMYLLAISSPGNMAKLEQIRSAVARLRDPRITTPAEAARIARETPPIGWINFGTDGNETSAFECSMQLAYQLAAGTDPLTRKILDNVVVILNPCLSPDSHQWFTTWAKAVTTRKRGNPDPQAAEHANEWFISTDGNHYLIDVNRDAFALTQLETQAASKALYQWNPQLWVDNHGEPEEYFFAPFSAPINLNYPPELLKWATAIGRSNARFFDQYGWTYVKDERYDLYYPGYWDAYPSFSGAVGMTYETNGGGGKGFAYERSDGTIATLRESVHAHFIADLSSLEVLADNREGFLKYYYAFRKSGMDEAEKEPVRQYILPPGTDPGRTHQLVELCLRHQIEVYRTPAPFSVQKAQTYFDRDSKPRQFPAGTYVIPLRQPQKRLLKALFEPDPRLEERFLKEVRATMQRNARLGSKVRKEPLWFYDVTAWSLPVTYGLAEASFSEDATTLAPEMQLRETVPPAGRVVGGHATQAYLFSFSTNAGARLCGRLLQEGYNVSLMLRGFENAGREFPPGTLLVRVGRNPDSVHERIQALAASCGVEVVAVNSGWAEKGISFGSVYVHNLRKPKIMVLTDEPTRATAFGSVYALLDQRYDLGFTALRGDAFESADLSRYNVVVFPDGSPAEYQKTLGEAGVARLKRWIDEGGTFIGLQGGAAFTTLKGVELTDVRLITEVPDRSAGKPEALKPVTNLPGAIFKGSVNTEYYLAVTQPAELAVQVRGDAYLSRSRAGANVVTFPERSLLMGHAWEDTEENLSDAAYLVDVPVGKGHVILFANDPTWRAYWVGLDRLFLAAILFPTAM
jgi:hypothetical protein